jgi:hypothetical protein
MPAGGYYIEGVRWSLDEEGGPIINAKVDGVEVVITMIQKTVLLDADIVLVQGDIDQESIQFNTTRISKGSGFVKSAALALEVRSLIRAYEEGKMTSDPRFIRGDTVG